MRSNIQNKRALLLTGTIVPNSIYTEYNDPQKRLADHMNALQFYRKVFPSEDIYFIENSEYDLDADVQFSNFRATVEFKLLRFPPSDKFQEGKGYQEFEMLDKAVEQLANRYSSFIKITGRYIVRNAAKITVQECEGLIIDMNRKTKYAHSFIMQFSCGFYLKNIKGLYQQVNDQEGRHIEHVIYRQIVANNAFAACSLFRRTPITEGTTGSYGLSLKRNPVRVFIRDIERFFYTRMGIPAFFY